MSNVGYAFVNFKSPQQASRCMDAFHNYRFKRLSAFKTSRRTAYRPCPTLLKAARPSQDLWQGGGGVCGPPAGPGGEPGALREDGGEHGEDEAAPAGGVGQHLHSLRRGRGTV